jgi:hypothetical protein
MAGQWWEGKQQQPNVTPGPTNSGSFQSNQFTNPAMQQQGPQMPQQQPTSGYGTRGPQGAAPPQTPQPGPQQPQLPGTPLTLPQKPQQPAGPGFNTAGFYGAAQSGRKYGDQAQRYQNRLDTMPRTNVQTRSWNDKMGRANKTQQMYQDNLNQQFGGVLDHFGGDQAKAIEYMNQNVFGGAQGQAQGQDTQYLQDMMQGMWGGQ